MKSLWTKKLRIRIIKATLHDRVISRNIAHHQHLHKMQNESLKYDGSTTGNDEQRTKRRWRRRHRIVRNHPYHVRAVRKQQCGSSGRKGNREASFLKERLRKSKHKYKHKQSLSLFRADTGWHIGMLQMYTKDA
jgi:hypothetical protein